MKKFPYEDGYDNGTEKFGIESLAAFAEKYPPANEDDITDLFSSKEIQKMINDFTGVEIPVTTIYELMTQMKYQYQFEENNFMWMVRKEN